MPVFFELLDVSAHECDFSPLVEVPIRQGAANPAGCPSYQNALVEEIANFLLAIFCLHLIELIVLFK